MTAAYDAVRAAADRLKPRAAVVLGSGLAGVAADFVPAAAADFADVPGLVPPTVAGHKGRLAVGVWNGVPTVLCSGRVHFYEGHPWDRVTRLVHLAAGFGVKAVILTNAAGGIRADLAPGDLMAIRGHLKLLDPEAWKGLPWEGEAPAEPQPPYSSRLFTSLIQLAEADGRPLPSGIYAAETGPCYETPAEVRFLRTVGADAVGMSTAVEAEAAAGLGCEVAAISTITNAAAGITGEPLSHHEVEVTARLAVGRLGRLIGGLLAAV